MTPSAFPNRTFGCVTRPNRINIIDIYVCPKLITNRLNLKRFCWENVIGQQKDSFGSRPCFIDICAESIFINNVKIWKFIFEQWNGMQA